MARLSINADDFGRDGGHNEAVVDAYRSGGITSASLLVVAGGFKHAVRMAKKYKIGVGLHLCLTCDAALEEDWRPLTGHACLTLDGKGKRFPNTNKKILWRDRQAVKEEVIAQYEKFISTGLKPTHVDAHMYCIPVQDSRFKYVLDPLCKKYPIRFIDHRKGELSRLAQSRRVIGWKSVGGSGFEGKLNRLKRMILSTKRGKEKVRWIHCHMDKSADRNNPRKHEYKLFTGGYVKKLCAKYSVRLWKPTILRG